MRKIKELVERLPAALTPLGFRGALCPRTASEVIDFARNREAERKPRGTGQFIYIYLTVPSRVSLPSKRPLLRQL